jgi:hypothetical protein
MKNSQKHLKISLFLALITLLSCNEESKNKETFVAQVGESKLTEAEINSALLGKDSKKLKEELIKNWVETEILYQQAIEKKLLTRENFHNVIKNSERELAAAISVNYFLNNHPVNFTEEDLREFYLSNKDDYSFSTNAYVLNYASFKTEESAISFRNDAIEKKWDEALGSFSENSELIEEFTSKIFKPSQIQSSKLLRVLSELYRDEISLVVETELNNYVVVQMIDKIDQGSIAPFDYIKDKVRENYTVYLQREQIQNFLDSLIVEKKVKVF